MIVLPWFIRFGLDCTIALTPLVYFHYHPSLFVFEYFQNRRRLVRRKSMPSLSQLSRITLILPKRTDLNSQKLKRSTRNSALRHDSYKHNIELPYLTLSQHQQNTV